MSFQDEETISLAVKSIEKAIRRIVQHFSVDAKAQRKIQFLIDHTGHLLRELYEKRESLRALLKWFREEWKRLESKLADQPLVILQHAMEHILRMSDGLVILTSGECRHPFDIRQAKKTKFPSKLSTLKEREDGYTCLYKSNAVYSGFGWDEFTNETVGIQFLLVKILKRFMKSPWDYLERKGATQLLESLLDQQESAVKELQQEVQDLKKRMMDDIRRRLRPKKFSFVTQDKMERLFVSSGDLTICLERRADNFQIKKGSILPNSNKQASDWQGHSLRLETKSTSESSSNKKRRLVIEESDSEEEFGQIAVKQKKDNITSEKEGTGLMVRIETAKPTEEIEDSLLAIKTQMGVDVQGLETSREELELEQKNKMKSITEGKEEKTTKLKRILQRVLSRVDVDDNEVWDARECLRQSYMELGNELLWSVKNFEKAHESFEKAKELVQQQQASHQRIVQSTNDDTFESRYIQRNLIFLLGQATVNTGIALVEWAQNERKGVIKRKANQANHEFRFVQKLTSQMKEQAEMDKNLCRVHSLDWRESVEDSLRANQLESLAFRWMGISLWLSSREKDAISAFEHASSFFQSNTNPRIDLLSSILELSGECIYATSTLVDLVCSAMERLGRNSLEKGDEYLEVISRSMKRYAEISETIERISSQDSLSAIVEDFKNENEICSSNVILQNLSEIEKWWAKKKNAPTDFGSRDRAPRLSSLLPRSDVFPNGLNSNYSEPTAHIMISEGRRQRKQKQSRESGYNKSSSVDAVRALREKTNDATKIIEFRKWGDELLPGYDKSVGTKLTYPSIAPAMPEEIRLYLETQ